MSIHARSYDARQSARAQRAERALIADNALLRLKIAKQEQERLENDSKAVEDDTAALDAIVAAMAVGSVLEACGGLSSSVAEAVSDVFDGDGGISAGGGVSSDY